MDVAAKVATFLASEGLGTLGTDLFDGEMPPQPTVATSVQDLTGTAPTLVLGRSSPAVEPYRFQVFTRSTTKALAHARAVAVKDALMPLTHGRIIDGTRFTSIQPTILPVHWGKDDQGRWIQQQVWEAWATP